VFHNRRHELRILFVFTSRTVAQPSETSSGGLLSDEARLLRQHDIIFISQVIFYLYARRTYAFRKYRRECSRGYTHTRTRAHIYVRRIIMSLSSRACYVPASAADVTERGGRSIPSQIIRVRVWTSYARRAIGPGRLKCINVCARVPGDSGNRPRSLYIRASEFVRRRKDRDGPAPS